MRTLSLFLASLVAVVGATGCKNVECGKGTIERGGTCAPADETTSAAACGPFTVLQGTECVPMFPPTECDPTTTTPDVDPATGVTTCIGTGGGGCAAPFACPPPTATKQTICGRIFDLETNAPFADTGATGAKCTTPAASGPCALQIQAFDALVFGANPTSATPLVVGGVDIDDCGRYRVKDISLGGVGPYIGLGFDDAGAVFGPTGVTVTVGIATPMIANDASKDVQGWVVPMSTTDKWTASGGPPLSTGYYVPIFVQHSTGFDPQSGVTFLQTMGSGTQAFYFTPAETTRTTIVGAATMTGANGTALVTGADVADNLAYTGTGGIVDTTNCKWETHAGATLPGIVFAQIIRPMAQLGHTCPL
jgi:hypothetical protein